MSSNPRSELRVLYDRILRLSSHLPKEYIYRKSVENLAKERANIVEQVIFHLIIILLYTLIAWKIFEIDFYIESNYCSNYWYSVFNITEWKYCRYRRKDKSRTNRRINKPCKKRNIFDTRDDWTAAVGKLDGESTTTSMDLASSQIILIVFNIFVNSIE